MNSIWADVLISLKRDIHTGIGNGSLAKSPAAYCTEENAR
jgi:hypothetical protein